MTPEELARYRAQKRVNDEATKKADEAVRLAEKQVRRHVSKV
jgi:hypothetical protein